MLSGLAPVSMPQRFYASSRIASSTVPFPWMRTAMAAITFAGDSWA